MTHHNNSATKGVRNMRSALLFFVWIAVLGAEAMSATPAVRSPHTHVAPSQFLRASQVTAHDLICPAPAYNPGGSRQLQHLSAMPVPVAGLEHEQQFPFIAVVEINKGRSASSSSSIGNNAAGRAALVACALLAFVMLAFPSSAHSLSLEGRVTLIEATMFTKADAAAEEIRREAKADEMRKEMKSDMAAMNFENRVFSAITLGISTVIPSATLYRAVKKDEDEKAQKILDEEKEKAQKINDDLSKQRSAAKDFQNFLSYFRS